ncbi:hypothetical protein M758_UG144800 [Ceratodon purpureus]|nr:hypothetical protein M758_UG144800 [Ceratodon purpureus]
MFLLKFRLCLILTLLCYVSEIFQLTEIKLEKKEAIAHVQDLSGGNDVITPTMEPVQIFKTVDIVVSNADVVVDVRVNATLPEFSFRKPLGIIREDEAFPPVIAAAVCGFTEVRTAHLEVVENKIMKLHETQHDESPR